jgi:tripartite-type tricarboxylate transporter receptor subunit TctC
MKSLMIATRQIHTAALPTPPWQRLRGILLHQPEVDTIAESGYKDYQLDLWLGLVDLWRGLVVPAKTPKQTTSQLAGWFTAAVQAPEVKAKLLAQAKHPAVTCGADFTVFLRSQYDEFGRAIQEANIKQNERVSFLP